MASSTWDKDYVHILMRKFQDLSPKVKIECQNLSIFENEYWKYDLNDLKVKMKPDLIILRIVENINKDLTEIYNFKSN